MACYHPLYRIEYNLKDKDGNLLSYKIDKQGRKKPTAVILGELEYKLKFPNGCKSEELRVTPIGCGQCIGCRLDYSRQWANRIVLESKKYKNDDCWFLTLTYDDEHVPTKTTKNDKTGEIKQGLTLKKQDLQKFIKKLRRHYEYHYNHTGIRFYAAGEYGETTNRPHYHLCMFNMPIFTKYELHKKNEIGQAIFTCEEIQKIWGLGFIAIAHQSWETAAYTARYMLKKQKGDTADWYYKSQAKDPEFTLCSRNPGIGKEYYDNNKQKIYKNDEIIIARAKGAQKIKPPKYYDTLYDIEEPEEMEEIKEKRRKQAENAQRLKMSRTTLDEWEQRAREERSKTERVRSLKREI